MKRFRNSVCLTLAFGAWALPMLTPAPARAQLWTWSREQMVEYTPAWTGERFADGRPKVSDGLLQRARGLSNEEITINWGGDAAPGGRGGGAAGGAGGGRGNPYGQYTDGWQVLHPTKKMVGRAFTLAFMPARPDLDAVVNAKARAKGIDRLGNQTAIDMLQPGDVVIGDPEGVSFVPPQFIEGIVDRADTTHVHDEWTKKKFDEGTYKSTDIYGAPHDPALIKEYQEYLKKRLEEIRKNNPK
jgi:hypothetical protein